MRTFTVGSEEGTLAASEEGSENYLRIIVIIVIRCEIYVEVETVECVKVDEEFFDEAMADIFSVHVTIFQSLL